MIQERDIRLNICFISGRSKLPILAAAAEPFRGVAGSQSTARPQCLTRLFWRMAWFYPGSPRRQVLRHSRAKEGTSRIEMLFARNYYWNKNDSYAWVSILRCRVQMIRQVLKMYIVHRNQKVVYDERQNSQHSRKKLFEQSREPKHPTEFGVEFRIEHRPHLTARALIA